MPGKAATPSLAEDRVERVVLPIAQAGHRLRARRILRGPLGQVNAARAQEGTDPGVARFAVDVREVVGVGVRRPVAHGPDRIPARKSLNMSFHARMCTSAVGVMTPSRSKSAASRSRQFTTPTQSGRAPERNPRGDGWRQRLVALRYCALASGMKITRMTADQMIV